MKINIILLNIEVIISIILNHDNMNLGIFLRISA